MIVQVHKAGGLDFECLQERHFEQPKVVETYPYEALAVNIPGPRWLLPICQRPPGSGALLAPDPLFTCVTHLS